MRPLPPNTLPDPKSDAHASTSPSVQDLQNSETQRADNAYVISQNGAVAADQKILSIMNQVEGLYEGELGLTIPVAYQSAWGTANDPYGSTNPSALLGELTDYWNSNRGSVARDVVHMWTGKSLDNATIGTAYLEALCRYAGSGRAAYGLSKGVAGGQQIAITAHEIGHNLGATHPNQQAPPVAECDNTVMSSSLSTNPQLTFCRSTRAMRSRDYLSSASGCLSAGQSQVSFAAANNYATGGSPAAVATGDFNGDGKRDLVVANSGSNNVSVLLGNDNSTFQSVRNYSVGLLPRALALGDFNNDGRQDIAVANSSSGTVSILIGDGLGGFGAPTNITVGTFPVSLAVNDFNGDGHSDLVVVNRDSNTLGVLLGTGTGTFQPAINFPSSSQASAPQSVAVGDFNGDGIQDLVVVHFLGGTNTNGSVLLGVGNGNFQIPVTFSAGASPVFVTAADFDGDGKQDVAVAESLGTGLSVQLGTGMGSFQAAIDYSTGSDSESIVVGDFNGDGKPDLAVANNKSNNLSVLIGTGSGGFQPALNYPVGANPSSVTVGDFNGDGVLDLAVANRLSDNVTVLQGSVSGGFQAAISFVTSFNPVSVAVGDFNADGKKDLAVAGTFPGRGVSVFLGTGAGGFQAALYYPGGAPVQILVTDLNGDGKQDLVTADEAFGVSVRLGTGTGTFPTAHYFGVPAGFLTHSLALGDFNRDGKQDVAVVSSKSNQADPNLLLSVLLGDGAGSFQRGVEFFVGPSGLDPCGMAVGDFNSDGSPDLVITNEVSNGTVTVLLGTGTGSFGSAVRYPVGKFPASVVIGDFNEDGKQDLAVANGGSDDLSALLGTGSGSFLPAVAYPVGGQPESVALGDLNGDGHQDLAVANLFSGDVSVLLGTGAGDFRSAINFASGSSRSVAIGDFNGDAKFDLAVANSSVANSNVSLLLNTSGSSLNSPANDNFVSARVISGATGTIAGTTVLATKETSEPNHASASNGAGGASIWYRWTAPSTGKFYFQTFSSSFPSVLAVYTGSSVGSLTSVVKSTTSVPEYVEWNAVAGTTYQIAMDGVTGDTGRTVLNWNTGSLLNDNFAFAREIRGSSGSVNGDNTNFTLETGEPTLPGASGTGFSAWYRWTAPNTGKVNFATAPCGDTTRLLGAYTGNFLDILSLVAVNYDGYRDTDNPGICDNRTLRFNAVAGTSYRIQMRSVVGKAFTLNWNYADPPANDNFVNALAVSGDSGSIVGTNKDATKEPGEPNHAGGAGGASVWYRWTASVSGPVTFDTIGFRNQGGSAYKYLTALMAIYTGSSLNGLTQVTASSSGNTVTFNAVAGTTYQIAVDSGPVIGGAYLPGIVPLHWGPKANANDNFANAQQLAAAGSFSPLLGSNAGATKEPGEPNHGGSPGGVSVWYRWTALSNSSASFVFNACSTCRSVDR